MKWGVPILPILAGLLPAATAARAAQPVLVPRFHDSDGWLYVGSAGLSNHVHSLQMSFDLERWTEIGLLHEGPFDYADPTAPSAPSRFYRTVSRIKAAGDALKNQVFFPDDPFRSPSTGLPEELRWIKFSMLLEEPWRVWFQDSDAYAFHYDFATSRLEPFRGMSRSQFDAVSLRTNQQQVVLGAVLYSPESLPGEYGIQFVGLDPYPPGQVLAWFDLVKAAIYERQPANCFYLPAFEQVETAYQNQLFFQTNGITLSRAERWIRDDAIYAGGWALAPLVYVPAAQIDEAYRNGNLRATDILLTDAVPAAVPYVAGIISLSPATPNSHVAILARSYGLPFVFISDPRRQTELQSWLGRDLVFKADPRSGMLRLFPVGVEIHPALRGEILEFKAPGAINLVPKAPLGAISANADGLWPSDIRYFGGKAAHFGVIRRTVPTHSPAAVSFSFDLWDAFLSQVLADSGKTCRQEIQDRLASYTYPPDMGSVQTNLAAIRGLIRNTADFTPQQKQEILQVLAVFDPGRKIRFRSSTNVEDSEQFTGAGLYDSHSGCLMDDLDDDTTGPSACDPIESNERGVFRAMRRVYASFYNDHAWLERLRFGLPEDQTGMAILAHHSFPDDEEMANGVASITWQRAGANRNYNGNLVTQLGAESVTNPDTNSVPEVVGFSKSASYTGLTLQQASNLVPLGDHVLDWQEDYLELGNLIAQVCDSYAAVFPQKTNILLDFEYKKMQPGILVLKQVREVGSAVPLTNTIPYLLNEALDYVVFQGWKGNVFANHRLKCQLALSTRNMRLSPANLSASLYRNAQMAFLSGTNNVTLADGLTAWPEYGHALDGLTARDSWAHGSGADRMQFALETTLVTNVPAAQPVLGQVDLGNKRLGVTYGRQVPYLDDTGTTRTTNQEQVALVPRTEVSAQSLLQVRQMTNQAGVLIETSYYWPRPPRGSTVSYTAPLVDWVQTRITGLTVSPIVLADSYAQTYCPGRHNFFEEFIFEPQLDPGVSPAQRQELQSANIQLLYSTYEFGVSAIYALGLDGTIRRLP